MSSLREVWRGVLKLHIIPKYIQGRGVLQLENFADITNGWPLMRGSKMKFLLSWCISKNPSRGKVFEIGQAYVRRDGIECWLRKPSKTTGDVIFCPTNNRAPGVWYAVEQIFATNCGKGSVKGRGWLIKRRLLGLQILTWGHPWNGSASEVMERIPPSAKFDTFFCWHSFFPSTLCPWLRNWAPTPLFVAGEIAFTFYQRQGRGQTQGGTNISRLVY